MKINIKSKYWFPKILLNYRCPKGTVDDTYSCGKTPEERKENYEKTHPGKELTNKKVTETKSTSATDNLKSAISEVKKEIKSGNVSDEQKQKLKTAIENVKQVSNTRVSKTEGTELIMPNNYPYPTIPLKNEPWIPNLMDRVGKINYGKLSPDNIQVLDNCLKSYKERCNNIGIPNIRGVSVENLGNYEGMISDGVLMLDKRCFVPPEKILQNNIKNCENDIKSERKEVKAAQLAVKNAYRIFGKDSTDSSVTEKVDKLNKHLNNIKYLENRINSLKSSGVDALKSNWKPTDDLFTRPYDVGEYFPTDMQMKLLIDHEFGHHVHETLGFRNEYKNEFKDRKQSKTEEEVDLLFQNAKKSKEPLCASKYGETSPWEWFAENYALHINGRDDLVHSEILKYFKNKKL